MAALGKVGSHYLQKKFRRDGRRFLKHFVICVLSAVAARSFIGQGLSCFCPAIVVGGDDVAPSQLFKKLLDELLEKGWSRGPRLRHADLGTSPLCRNSGSWSKSSTRSRPDVGDVLSFCSAQAGYRSRRHLYKICIVTNHTCGLTLFELSHPSVRPSAAGVPVDDACDPWVYNAM